MSAKKSCKEDGCELPKFRSYHRCVWHYLMTQPMDEQVRYAAYRLKVASERDGFVHRSRVKPEEWPAGKRWCAGCQWWVPLFYVPKNGSRCRACNSRANYASHLEKTYDITVEEYERLLAFQGGRCAICGQQPKARRLAIDHDHETGAVRGLLCSADEWGCNVSLRKLLNDPEMARRAYAYVLQHPFDRMKAGLPGISPR